MKGLFFGLLVNSPCSEFKARFVTVTLSWDIPNLSTWYQHCRLVCCYSLLILMLLTWIAYWKKHSLLDFFAYLPLISLLFLCCSCRKQGSREGGRDSELPDVCEDEATS